MTDPCPPTQLKAATAIANLKYHELKAGYSHLTHPMPAAPVFFSLITATDHRYLITDTEAHRLRELLQHFRTQRFIVPDLTGAPHEAGDREYWDWITVEICTQVEGASRSLFIRSDAIQGLEPLPQ